MDCRACITLPAMRTGTAAASVIGSGIIKSAVPKVSSFFPVFFLSLTRFFTTEFVSLNEGRVILSANEFAASFTRLTFLLEVSTDGSDNFLSKDEPFSL